MCTNWSPILRKNRRSFTRICTQTPLTYELVSASNKKLNSGTNSLFRKKNLRRVLPALPSIKRTKYVLLFSHPYLISFPGAKISGGKGAILGITDGIMLLIKR